MTRGRPARPDEIPRYGSIWTYARPDVSYVVLGVTEQGWLSSIRIEPDTEPVVGTHLFWRSRDHVLQAWRCIDEGPE